MLVLHAEQAHGEYFGLFTEVLVIKEVCRLQLCNHQISSVLIYSYNYNVM